MPTPFDPNEFATPFDPNEFATPPPQASQFQSQPPANWYESAWDTAASYIPQPVKSGWEELWKPRTEVFSRTANRLAEPMLQEWDRTGQVSGAPDLLPFYLQALGMTGDSLSSIGNAATMIPTGGGAAVAKMGLPAVGKAITNVGRAAGGLTAAHGVQGMTDPNASMFDRGMGLVETVGGGLAAKAPPINPTVARLNRMLEQDAVPPNSAQRLMQIDEPAGDIELPPPSFAKEPVAEVAPPIQKAPIQKAAPITQASGVPEFDPSTLKFADSRTGQPKSIAEAKPGDVPIIDEAPVQPVIGTQQTPRPKPTSISEWAKELLSDESGEFDPTFSRWDEPEQNRTVERPEQSSGSLQEDIQNLGLDSIDMNQLPNSVYYYNRIGRRDIVDYLLEQRMWPNFANKTFDEIGRFVEHYTRNGQSEIADWLTRRAHERNSGSAVEQAGGRVGPSTPERDIRYDPSTETYFNRNTTGWDDVSDATPEEMTRARGIVEGTVLDPAPLSRRNQTTPVDRNTIHQTIRRAVEDGDDTAVLDFIRRHELYPDGMGPTGSSARLVRYGREVAQERGITVPEPYQPARQGTGRATREDLIGRNERIQAERNRPSTRATERPTYDYGAGDKQGKTLEEVESVKNKRTPALERLGKLIGTERAQKLASGEAEIKFNEPAYRPRGKRLTDRRSWHFFAEDSLKYVDPDPEKPGVTVKPHSIPETFPNAFTVEYRDATGKPIGVLITDLQGTGISTLAVDPKIGLRRGKVAFEMLKQSFDRGVMEPYGGTSQFTKNIIERVKRLYKDESGELDIDTLVKGINSVIDGFSKSKFGQSVKKLIVDESGELDTGKLRQLFKKQQEGTITPEELAQAKEMVRANPEAAANIKEFPKGKRKQGKMSVSLNLEGKEIGQGNIAKAAKEKPSTPNPQAAAVEQNLMQRMKSATQDPAREISEMLEDAEDVIKNAEETKKPGLIRQVLGYNKALLTAWDLSAPGRQGKAFMANKEWLTSLDDMVKAWWSPKAAEIINQSIMDHPSGYFQKLPGKRGKIQKSFAEMAGLDLASIEEPFVSSAFKKIENATGVAKSSRAHTAFLNKLRSDMFVSMMNDAKKAGRSPETNLELAKAYAKFINDATGRGSVNVGSWKLQRNVGALNDVFFAPKNMSGQIRTWNGVLNPMRYAQYDNTLRKQALRSLFAVAGAGLMAGEIARQAGARVSNDPFSSDFRKIRIGDTRIDMFGGYQQFPVAAMKFIMGKETPTAGQQAGRTQDLTKGSAFRNRQSVAERFFTNRLSPVGSFIWAWMNNREFDGKPFEVKRALYERTAPIVLKDLMELGQEDPEIAAILAPTSVLGLTGTQHYSGR